eukprot:TRINITY_DN15758_c0_g1_i1.p1 TRINITY_DN15758_c0_g1~~TRINITY_DN15758_c0_g1_i1.p1  ORF type:complete len:178 (+),score=37.10 TRINITY_DN15758_c0_g1_i1:130-663(+)
MLCVPLGTFVFVDISGSQEIKRNLEEPSSLASLFGVGSRERLQRGDSLPSCLAQAGFEPSPFSAMNSVSSGGVSPPPNSAELLRKAFQEPLSHALEARRSSGAAAPRSTQAPRLETSDRKESRARQGWVMFESHQHVQESAGHAFGAAFAQPSNVGSPAFEDFEAANGQYQYGQFIH